MDVSYIIIIVLFALILFACYMIYREILKQTDIIQYHSRSTNALIDTRIKELDTNISDNINTAMNKIKTMNTENMRQLHNITLLNSQPITKITNPNHFTETDSDYRNNEINIRYLSDTVGY